MPRKKTNRKNTDTEPTENAATAVMEAETHDSTPIPRPAWIDGAPVDADGQVIRDGFPQPTPQMELANSVSARSTQPSEPVTEAHGKNWGDPYKTIFSCPEVGFELGENRRFKQRVFRFTERPNAEILSALKEHGFVYRAVEKAWTVNATPQSRKLTDDLARTWAGPNYVQGVER